MLLLHTGADAEHICLSLCSNAACLPASDYICPSFAPNNQFVKPLHKESCQSWLKMAPIREVRGTIRKANSDFPPSEYYYGFWLVRKC